MYILLAVIIAVLAAFLIYFYFRERKTLNRIDEMIDSAADGRFEESRFTERWLNRTEAKMYRYLSAGQTSYRRIEEERNAVKELVSDISHQTKTPVSNILLYTQLLRENPASGNAENMLVKIEEQTEKLKFLIQSLVKISRLENGIVAVTPTENSVKRLIESIDYTAAAQENGVRFTVHDIPDMIAVFDFKWTAEAIANIVDNAVKYTPRGGNVSVKAAEYEMFVRVDIADTGIGISEEETAKIFMRFYRSAAVRDERGVGIGLYIAREIITRQGGYIKVSSEPEKGSVFSVFLPKTTNLSKP